MSEQKVQIALPARKHAAEELSTAGGFIAGGLAACGAVTFTNPIELIKTRMQLQGELSLGAAKVYKNPFQAFALIYRNEGIRGLQQGLVCGWVYQLGLNGCRLGLYEPTRYYLTKWTAPETIVDGKVPQGLAVNVAAGLLAGAAGAVVASPFFLIKTRMQSYNNSLATGSVVGQQTHYRGIMDGLSKIYSAEGVRGLFRGMDAAILRTGLGSAAQLPIYNYAKSFLVRNKIVDDNSVGLHFLASSAAGLGVAIVMNPGDVVLTRVYNQKGNLYKGPVDCLVKTVRAEGVGALYKGFWAQLFRIGPHSILTLMFMEQTMKLVMAVERSVRFA